MHQTNSDDLDSILHARTFCHFDDVEAMRAIGLAKGGSLSNAVVVTDDEVMNEDGLRSTDEFARHKLLDCIGDLGLLGADLIGRVVAHKAGHRLHGEFMKALMAEKHRVLTIVESDRYAARRWRGGAWSRSSANLSPLTFFY